MVEMENAYENAWVPGRFDREGVHLPKTERATYVCLMNRSEVRSNFMIHNKSMNTTRRNLMISLSLLK